MRNLPFYTFFIASIFILFSCSSAENKDENKTVTGSIVIVGNEPFTNLAVKVDEKTTYILDVEDKEQEKELKSNQGNYYIISYKTIDGEHPGDTLKVSKIQPAK